MTDIKIIGLTELNRKLTALGGKLRGVEGKVGIKLEYAPFVGSSQFQAAVHRGRWETDQGALDQELPAITADFNRAVAAACASPSISSNPLLPPMQRAVLRIQRRMALNPAARPGSKYRRTGTYGRKWTTKVTQK